MPASRRRRVTIEISNDIADMSKVAVLVDAFGAEHEIEQGIVNAVNLSLDEILNNTISYGYKDQKRHHIKISLSVHKRDLVAEVQDDGIPFDPLEVALAPLRNDLRTRKIGGVGLHFVMNLMDDVQYSRRQGFNRLRLRKRISDPI